MGKPESDAGGEERGNAMGRGLGTRLVSGSTALVALLALALASVQVQAATFDVGFAGLVDDGVFASWTDGTTHYDQWTLGLTTDSPFTVSPGDSVNATITLDRSVTIPASVSLTSFLFGLQAAPKSFPGGDTGTSGTTTFLLGGAEVLSAGGGTGSSGWIPNGITLSPPDNGAITFDSVVSNFTITTLSAPATITGALAYYTLFSPAPVPEAETYAMMIAGLGMLGAVARRRKSVAV